MSYKLYFQTTPDGFADSLGASFSVDDLDDFMYEYSDDVPNAFLSDDQTKMFYTTGTDAGGFYMWDIAFVQVENSDGGDGGL